MTSEMQSVADAIVQAIRVATSQTSQAPHSSSSGTMRTYDRVSTTVSGTSGSVSGSGQRLATSMMINDHPGPSSSTAPSPAGTKRKLVIPTMFQSKGAKRSKPVKTVRYLRDIFCLPRDVLNGETGTIGIPRGTRRNSLANKDVGLLGKIEFESVWSAERMKQEISRVPFELSEEDISRGECIEFEYLQRTGAGSRTLCVPAVASSFEWNGRQVATLAKSGGIIYILAKENIPVCKIVSLLSADVSCTFAMAYQY